MKILDLTQGTQEWIDFRYSKVTATDIACIMTGGENQAFHLLKRKKNREGIKRTSSMLRGSAMEDIARRWRFGNKKTINNPCIMNEDCDWLMASLDVLHAKDRLVAEIKCPEEPVENAQLYAGYKKAWWQVQCALYVTGYDRGEIIIYHPLMKAVEIIERDEKAIQDLLIKGKQFYDLLISEEEIKTSSIEDNDNDFYEKAKKIEENIKFWSQKKEELKNEAILKHNKSPFVCFGLTLTKVEDSETVDYKKAAICNKLDLSDYKTIKEGYWRLTIK